jgi:hypothetical protein
MAVPTTEAEFCTMSLTALMTPSLSAGVPARIEVMLAGMKIPVPSPVVTIPAQIAGYAVCGPQVSSSTSRPSEARPEPAAAIVRGCASRERPPSRDEPIAAAAVIGSTAMPASSGVSPRTAALTQCLPGWLNTD